MANNTSAVPPPHDFAVTCHKEFKLSLSQFGQRNRPVFGSRQVSPSISRQALQGVAEAWRDPAPGCSWLSAGIVNPLSEYKITHQTLRVSRWDPLLPVIPPPPDRNPTLSPLGRPPRSAGEFFMEFSSLGMSC